MSRFQKRAKQFWKSFRELVKQSPLSRGSLLASFLIFIVTLFLPIWRIMPLAKEQPFIPLHYNVYFGVDRFGPWYYAFVIPSLGLLFVIISAVMQTYFFQRERMLTQFFAWSTLFLELIFFLAMVLLILLNI